MIHVIIAQERRKEPRELAIVINCDEISVTPEAPVVTPKPPQLHTMGSAVADLADAQIVYAAEWDGVSPFVTVLKGNIASLRMAYMGWPLLTEAEWLEKQNVA